MTEFKISSYCTYGNCVEVGTALDGSVIVRVRGDGDRIGSVTFTREEWAAFLKGVKAGEFDLPDPLSLTHRPCPDPL